MIQALTPELITALGDVRRWHTRPALRGQTVAEHSAQVALLAVYLDPDLKPEEIAQTLLWGLLHDAHEATFGDMPSPAKAALRRAGMDADLTWQDMFWGPGANPARTLPGRLLDLVDVADMLEAALFARQNLPALAQVIRQQAEEQIHTRLTGRSVPCARAMQALEER